MCWVREDTRCTFVSFKIITPQYHCNLLYTLTHAHTHILTDKYTLTTTHMYTLKTTHADILLYIIIIHNA